MTIEVTLVRSSVALPLIRSREPPRPMGIVSLPGWFRLALYGENLLPLTRLDFITFSCIRLLNGSGRVGWTDEDLGGEFLLNLGEELYHLFPVLAASPPD